LTAYLISGHPGGGGNVSVTPEDAAIAEDDLLADLGLPTNAQLIDSVFESSKLKRRIDPSLRRGHASAQHRSG